jgi:hypothetical protein
MSSDRQAAQNRKEVKKMVSANFVSARYRARESVQPNANIAISFGKINPALTRDQALVLRNAINMVRGGPVFQPQLVITERLQRV